MTDLGSRFIESRGHPIEHDGQLVHIAWVLGPVPAGVLRLRMRAKGDLEQGVGISADGGWLTVNGERSKQGALWTTTAPDEVEIVAKPLRGRPALTVRVWNIWKHPKRGSTMSSTANAGLVVERISDGAARLHASAGPGEPTFDDLVVDVAFEAN
ncbi:hypothetical protein AAII07_05025 [Microvirga sp. 0TCS3.31]